MAPSRLQTTGGSPMVKWWLTGWCMALAACGPQPEDAHTAPQYSTKAPSAVRQYVFAIHPLHNPARLFALYGPLIDYLNRHLPDTPLRLEASRNYEEFEKKLYGRQLDFALPNPYQTLNSLHHGYRVIAKMGDDQLFTGLILVRRDSDIRKTTDLKGKKVAYPAATALAATMMPQYYLQTHGLDVQRDIENVYVGSQESSILNVYYGNTAAAATWPLPWREFQKEQPEKAAELEVKWQTEHLINNGVVVRDDVPPELAEKVTVLLETLHTTSEGEALLQRLELSQFERADNRRYQVIKEFLHLFSQKVRPLPERLP